jgi:ferredoxin
MAVSKRIVLHFPKRLVDQPIVCRLVKEYNLDFNILKASITPDDEGLMVLELKGKQADFDRGIGYLSKSGLRIQPLSQNVIRNEERCTHCGACVAICPAAAFEVDPVTRLVNFRDEKCLVCGICLTACPPRAMELHF